MPDFVCRIESGLVFCCTSPADTICKLCVCGMDVTVNKEIRLAYKQLQAKPASDQDPLSMQEGQ